MYRHNLIWVAIFGVIVLMFLRLPPMAAKQDAVVNTYSALVEVDALAKQQFVDPITDDRLVDGAIRGMMFQLDPYSGYIAPQELPAFERRSRGVFSGVGIEIGMLDGQLMVIAPIEESPAARAGVLAGDAILAIDGRDLDGRSVFEAEELLVGPSGTAVRIRIRHQGQRQAKELTIVRGPVSLKSVRGFRRHADGRWDYGIDPEWRIGYIRVANFRDNTMHEFDAALRTLLDQSARALILDLRFNPGGVMHPAAEMVDRFVDQGLILSTVTRRGAVDEYYATPENTVGDLKLVVLVNGSSASSAEIVAGALQARKRAVIVGQRSFGKGSVQHLIHLSGHRAAIKLTVAYYRLPDGSIIHRTEQNSASDAWGVKPDVGIVLSDEEVQAIQVARRALDVGPGEIPDSSANGLALEIARDRQLREALEVARRQIENRSDFGD